MTKNEAFFFFFVDLQIVAYSTALQCRFEFDSLFIPGFRSPHFLKTFFLKRQYAFVLVKRQH